MEKVGLVKSGGSGRKMIGFQGMYCENQVERVPGELR
jgi:hypothetical protein